MGTIIRKKFYDHENEEKWLNEMSDKGLLLTNYTWGKYTFEDCAPQAYTYRIEMLDAPVTSPKSVDYLAFMADAGIEHVATYGRWVYLRKKRADGPFDVYSDIDSRIKHYQRIGTVWTVLAFSYLPMILVFSSQLMQHLSKPHGAPFYILIVAIFASLTAIIVFFCIGRPYRKKIKMLKKEKDIME